MSFNAPNTISREERISGVRVQSSCYGKVIPIYYGPNRMTPNLLWSGDFVATEHSQTVGGKGGGESTSINYTYTTAVMLGLGEGTISASSIMPNKDAWKTPAEWGFESFSGAVGQSVWGTLTSKHPTEALAYSGTAHLSVAAFDLGNTASIPNFSVIGTGQASITTRLALYISDYLTNSRYGAGFPASRLSGLTAVDDFLLAQGVTFSPFAVEQRQTSETLREWTDAANIGMVWSEGLLKFIPRLDSMGVAYALGVDDFIVNGSDAPVRVSRKPTADAFNQLQVEYLDSAHEYNIAIAEAKDQANIDQYGLRPAPNETCHAAKSASVARWVAQHRLQRALYVRNVYRFNLGWKHSRLEPMDVVTLTDPLLGLSAVPVLITEISEDEQGTLEVVAEDYSGAVTGALIYTAQTPTGAVVNQGISPGNANAPVIFEPPVSLAGVAQLWIATSGGANWGGCEVWASFDNATYSRVGVIEGKARHGTLRSALATGSALDTSHTLAAHMVNGQLLPGTTQDAVDRLTLCYVDGEYIAYRDSTLVGAGDYDLGYLVRSCYGSTIAAHSSGTKIARCDDSLFRLKMTDVWTGRTVYIKLLSYNIWGGGKQALSDVSPYTYTVSGFPVVSVTGFGATVFQTSVTLAWNAITAPTNYDHIEVLRSDDNNSAHAVVIAVLAPGAIRYTDTVGASGVTRYYWMRLVGTHGEAGPLSGMATAITGVIGGLYVTASMPASTYLGYDAVYYSIGDDIWEWNGSAYVRALPVVNASQINAANLSAISANLGSITAGSMNIGGKFIVAADGTLTTVGAASIGGALNAATGTFAGTLTAAAVNAVDTINIAGNAVTVPSSAYTAGSISSGTGTDTVVQTLTITASGQPVVLIASGAFINSATYAELTIRIKRDGTEIYSSVSLYQLGGLFSISAVDTPSSGSRTYTVTVSALSASFYGAVTVSSRSMIALEAKR